MGLDLNRGVRTKVHPGGFHVSMYWDDPGTYYDNAGNPVAPQIAEAAGFDIVKDAREKLKKQKLAAYQEQLEAELATEEENIAKALTDKSGRYDVRHVGGGQYAIFDGENRVTKVAMSAADVELLIGQKPSDPHEPGASPAE